MQFTVTALLMRRLLLEWKKEKQTVTDACIWQKERGKSKTVLKKKLVIYGRQKKMLDRFRQCCLRNILGINALSVAPDSEILSRADSISVKTRIHRHRNRWVVHVIRMEDNRLHKQTLSGEAYTQKTAFVSVWRTHMIFMTDNPNSEKARDRNNLRASIQEALKIFPSI